MSNRYQFRESVVEQLGCGYYMVMKRFAPEWCRETFRKEEVEHLFECIHDFDVAFQFRVVKISMIDNLSFNARKQKQAGHTKIDPNNGKRQGHASSGNCLEKEATNQEATGKGITNGEMPGQQTGDTRNLVKVAGRNYGRQLVLIVKRLKGIPDEGETIRRMNLLNEMEHRRFHQKEEAAGRKKGEFRGCKAYSGQELSDLGVFMHRMILRLTFQWLETHGGGRKRVFLASYHSFLIDVESLRRFGQLSEAELKDCGEEKKPTTDCPRLYAEDGVVGTREFHRLLRGESGENLKRMENPRNRMGRELLHTMLERIQEEDLREELRVILHDWKEGIIDALQNPNLSLHMGAGTQSEEAHRQLLVAVLVGFASFGWCISSAVVKQVYRKWETMRLKNQEEKSKRPAGESCPQGAMGGNPKRN